MRKNKKKYSLLRFDIHVYKLYILLFLFYTKENIFSVFLFKIYFINNAFYSIIIL